MPEDLYPVIEPMNMSERFMDFIGKVDRSTTKVFVPLDTTPSIRKDAAPMHNSLHSADPRGLLMFLDAATLHETVFAHEVGHAWVQYVDLCEDERTLADLSDSARLNQFNFIQSYVLDLKVNELLRKKGFDMSPIDGDQEIAMNNIAKLLDSGFTPPTKREAVFGALQFAEQIVELERGNRQGLVRFDDALTKLKRYDPEVHMLAMGMAEAVFEFGIESKEAICNTIDKCLNLAFAFTGDPLDFENDLVVPSTDEPDFDKWPDWIPGAFPKVKCQVGRAMALHDISDDSKWSISYHRISGADVTFQLDDGSTLGPWRISTPYSRWNRQQMEDVDKINREATERQSKIMNEVKQRNSENQRRQALASGDAMQAQVPSSPNLGSSDPARTDVQPVPKPMSSRIPGRRMYMPGLGRFLTEARLAERLGGEHAYSYANNNPSGYVDPQGLAPQTQTGKDIPRCPKPSSPKSKVGHVFIDCNCLKQGAKIWVLPETEDLDKNPQCGKWIPADAIIVGPGRFEQIYKIHGQTCAYFNCPPDDPDRCYLPRFERVYRTITHATAGTVLGWKVQPSLIDDFCKEFCNEPCPCRGYP